MQIQDQEESTACVYNKDTGLFSNSCFCPSALSYSDYTKYLEEKCNLIKDACGCRNESCGALCTRVCKSSKFDR